jgi:hypothetical protein
MAPEVSRARHFQKLQEAKQGFEEIFQGFGQVIPRMQAEQPTGPELEKLENAIQLRQQVEQSIQEYERYIQVHKPAYIIEFKQYLELCHTHYFAPLLVKRENLAQLKVD